MKRFYEAADNGDDAAMDEWSLVVERAIASKVASLSDEELKQYIRYNYRRGDAEWLKLFFDPCPEELIAEIRKLDGELRKLRLEFVQNLVWSQLASACGRRR